jgi:hypothetical protein
MEDLGAASLDDVREFFSTWYRPDNATLTIVGDFAPDEAKSLVERYFGDIPAGGPFPKFEATRTPASHEKRETFASPVQLPRIYRLYHLPKMGERDWIHGDLLTTILASDKASRLDRVLVHEKQIAQDVAMYVLPTEATGLLLLQATAREGIAIEAIESAIDEEIANLSVSGITDDELTRAKNRGRAADVTFSHGTPGTYDPATDTTTGGSVSTVTGTAMEIAGDPNLYLALGLIESENPTLLFTPDTAGELPVLGATVEWGGETLTVKNITRLAMAGTPEAAKLVVSRG